MTARFGDPRVRVFVAASADGFIAGRGGDLSWLPHTDQDFGYDALIADVGALLMGRATYDTAAGFERWPHGDLPVLVATSRPLERPAAPTVRAVSGSPADLRATALEAAAGRDVYLDGGALVRALLDACVVDELTITTIPVVLGAGAPLLAGAARGRRLELLECRAFGGGIVQLRYRPGDALEP